MFCKMKQMSKSGDGVLVSQGFKEERRYKYAMWVVKKESHGDRLKLEESVYKLMISNIILYIVHNKWYL